MSGDSVNGVGIPARALGDARTGSTGRMIDHDDERERPGDDDEPQATDEQQAAEAGEPTDADEAAEFAEGHS